MWWPRPLAATILIRGAAALLGLPLVAGGGEPSRMLQNLLFLGSS